jgi:hypothetical protein
MRVSVYGQGNPVDEGGVGGRVPLVRSPDSIAHRVSYLHCRVEEQQNIRKSSQIMRYIWHDIIAKFPPITQLRRKNTSETSHDPSYLGSRHPMKRPPQNDLPITARC